MAVLKKENGVIVSNLSDIQKELADLSINLKHYAPNDKANTLLQQESLETAQKEEVLKFHDELFEVLKKEEGYQSRDLIVLNPNIENLEMMLNKFSPCHTHDDDEVRYIVDGEGVFGFVKNDGTQMELLVQAGDYINVPKDTEHWFVLTNSKRIKAIRYFTTMDGWSPVYTETQKRL